MTSKFEYSENGLRNRSLFYGKDNDINIYVEDSGKRYIYEEIFKRLLGKNYRIESIFPLGGKKQVLKEYVRKGESGSNGNPNVFLVDGDFDRYIGYESANKNDYKGETNDESELNNFISGKIFESKSVIYLKSYNIENYFIDENAIISHIKGILEKTDSEIFQILDYSKWRNRIVNESKDLFLIYCFIEKYKNKYGYKYNGDNSKLSIKTVSRGAFPFLDVKTGFKSNSNELENLYKEVKEALEIENPKMNLDCELKVIQQAYELNNGKDYYHLICGKFLLESLRKYLHDICNRKLDLQNFKWHLVLNFEINKLDYIKEKILDL